MKKFFLKNIKKIKSCFLCLFKCRPFWLVFWSILGFGLAVGFANLDFKNSCYFDFLEQDKIFGTLFLVILSLATGFYLWFLRNKDKLAQLKKADESNNFNNFSNAMQLFTQENKTSKAIGLKLLMDLKHKKLYEKQIDLATQNSDLKNLDLEDADLSGGNFKGANLENANLKNAILKGAILSDIKFRILNMYFEKYRKKADEDCIMSRVEIEKFIKSIEIDKNEENDKDIFRTYHLFEIKDFNNSYKIRYIKVISKGKHPFFNKLK